MKRILYLSLGHFFCLTLLCSNYIISQQTWFNVGDKYTYSAEIGWTSTEGLFQYEVMRDTTYLGFSGHLVRERRHGNSTYYMEYLLYQDGEKVYFRGSQHSILLYDFGAQPGDTIKYDHVESQYKHVVIVSVGDTIINGRKMKYQVWDKYASDTDKQRLLVLEKIGIVGRYKDNRAACSGFLHTYDCTYRMDFINYYFQCYDSKQYSYFREEPCIFNSIYSDNNSFVEKNIFYPNPSTGDIMINKELDFDKIIVFNNNGQKIKEVTDPNTKSFKIEQTGICFIYIIGENGTSFQKLLVIH